MKQALAYVAVLFIATTALSQSVQTVSMGETISVGGTSHLSLVPDRVTFTVGVQSSAPTVDQAVADNNQRIGAVVAALKKAGATDKDVRTSNFSIMPEQDYTQGQVPRIIGYQVSNSVNVTRENVSDAGRLLQAAVNAGVNTASGLNFAVSDPARGQAEGLKAAFGDARAKAAVLAQVAGRTLGRALSISDEGAAPPPRPMPVFARAMSMKGDVGQIPIESGTQEIMFAVSVRFELK